MEQQGGKLWACHFGGGNFISLWSAHFTEHSQSIKRKHLAICGGAGFTENFETMTISGVCPECGADAAIEQNENLKYILKFLSNGGRGNPRHPAL